MNEADKQAQPVSKDAEEWGPHLNEAAWAALEAWDSNSRGPMPAIVFNNIKPIIRAAILKYCEGYTTTPAQPVQPVVAQGEPVHFRAVICAEQQVQAAGVVPKVVGFIDKKAAEQFILEKRDFQGWRYSLEPLYTESPAVAVNEQLYKALRHLYYNAKNSGAEMGVALDVAEDAIAAAEAAKGGV